MSLLDFQKFAAEFRMVVPLHHKWQGPVCCSFADSCCFSTHTAMFISAVSRQWYNSVPPVCTGDNVAQPGTAVVSKV